MKTNVAITFNPYQGLKPSLIGGILDSEKSQLPLIPIRD